MGGGWKISIGELAVFFTFSELRLMSALAVSAASVTWFRHWRVYMTAVCRSTFGEPFSGSEGLSLRLKLFLGPARPAYL